jgi:hypothetical protein
MVPEGTPQRLDTVFLADCAETELVLISASCPLLPLRF